MLVKNRSSEIKRKLGNIQLTSYFNANMCLFVLLRILNNFQKEISCFFGGDRRSCDCVFCEFLAATSTQDIRLWIWIYLWTSMKNLRIWIWMGNIISTAS